MVPLVIFSYLPVLQSQLAELADSLFQALLNPIVAESRTVESTSSSLCTLPLKLLNMISARWNLAVGPVIMVVGAFGAVLAATVANEFSGNKQEKVSEEKIKP